MIDKTEINPESAHRDRVAQVYCGIIKWGDSGEILRQRIDWMVDQARGPRILDVGCSEGVLEILLARKGFNVTGVDINAEALAFARDLLAREPEEVRSRVRFVHGDLAQSAFARRSLRYAGDGGDSGAPRGPPNFVEQEPRSHSPGWTGDHHDTLRVSSRRRSSTDILSLRFHRTRKTSLRPGTSSGGERLHTHGWPRLQLNREFLAAARQRSAAQHDRDCVGVLSAAIVRQYQRAQEAREFA